MIEFRKRSVLTTTILISSVCYGLYISSLSKVKSPVIQTKSGLIQGFESDSRQGRKYYEFLGIPYAVPPVGKLRFEPPVSVPKWDGVKYSSQYGPECPQIKLFTTFYKGQEDCLYLNIFVPKVSTKGSLSVMVWIHGGSFATGSSNEFRPEYFMDEDVILVTINYRLAALGFLSTEDDIVKGNMGLKDQVLALKWLQANIEAFGGDPKKVTLFGESAGSSAVSFHILSPSSTGLLSKAILQSGVATSTWSISKDPAQHTKRLADKLGCPTKIHKEMADCMKKVDAKTLVLNHEEVYDIPVEAPKLFSPTIERIKDRDSFLTEDPLEILKARSFKAVPIINGVNSEEGLIWSAIFCANQTKLDEANDDFYKWIGKYLLYPKEQTLISDRIRQFYFGDVPSIATPEYITNYTNLLSDRHFFSPIHEFVTHYSQHVPIYLYYLTYRGSFRIGDIYAATESSSLPKLINIFISIVASWVKTNVFQMTLEHPGVCHAEDMFYLFDWPENFLIKRPASDELQFSIDLVRLWVSFANDDNHLNFRNTLWTPTNPKDPTYKYLQLDDKPSMIAEPFTHRVKFWESLGL